MVETIDAHSAMPGTTRGTSVAEAENPLPMQARGATAPAVSAICPQVSRRQALTRAEGTTLLVCAPSARANVFHLRGAVHCAEAAAPRSVQ
jgi:hypothetical protein